MNGHADQWIAERVRWKAKGYFHQPSKLLFFDGGDADSIKKLRNVVEQRLAGSPLMAFWRSDDLWTLLCADKLLWMRNGPMREVLIDSLKWADSPAMMNSMLQEVDTSAASRHKLECETLRVTDKAGAEFLVWTAPGGGCLILWNVLRMLIGMQKESSGSRNGDAATIRECAKRVAKPKN